jgi:hypothetical protein
MAYRNTEVKAPVNQITTKDILNYVSEIEIMEYYLGQEVQFQTQFVSPIREDDSPGCKYWVSENTGRINYIDKARGINEDCFGIVKHIYNINFDQAIKKIASDFNLSSDDSSNIVSDRIPFFARGLKTKIIKRIHSVQHTWQPSHITFWKSFGYSGQQIKDMFIFPLLYGFVNNRQIYKHSKDDIGFIYYFPDNSQKLYFPFRKSGQKFITDSKYIQGYNLLPEKGDVLIITKSYKDIGVVNNLGYPAISPQSETSWIPEDIMKDLRSRFKTIYLLFDNDKAGRMHSDKRIEENPDLIPIFVPDDLGNDETDISDVRLHVGFKETVEIFNHMLLTA